MSQVRLAKEGNAAYDIAQLVFAEQDLPFVYFEVLHNQFKMDLVRLKFSVIKNRRVTKVVMSPYYVNKSLLLEDMKTTTLTI